MSLLETWGNERLCLTAGRWNRKCILGRNRYPFGLALPDFGYAELSIGLEAVERFVGNIYLDDQVWQGMMIEIDSFQVANGGVVGDVVRLVRL